MCKPRVILAALAALWFALSSSTTAQQRPDVEIESLSAESLVEYDFESGVAVATNGVLVKSGTAVLTADRARVDPQTGEAEAEGRVRIQQGEQVWVGDFIRYNFLTRQMQAEQFRTGRSPVFAAGEELRGDLTNQIYTARNAYITTDDVAEPAQKVRAKYIKINPGKSIEARHAVLYLGPVPVFYFPYYSRTLKARENNFSFIPGYRSLFGPFLFTTYNWFLSDEVDGALRLDYRGRRGLAGGADANLHLGRWGETAMKYYYLHDQNPDIEDNGLDIPADRQRAQLHYDAMPFTNLNVKAAFNYQSDELVLHDFFESEYRHDPQPITFAEVNKLWSNFSLDLYAQPQVNDFFDTVERLPDVKLSAFRQQIGPSPLFYESESSAGYYRRRFAETNDVASGLDYSAARADTFHQITLPQTFFGWLNVTPRAGGRFTYYSAASGPGGTNNEVSRGIFNTGAEVTFKASRLWPAATNRFLAVDGLRHIVEPGFNYVYVPTPNQRPPDLPQFDYEVPSLRLLPIDFPDYNAIDSIDSQNVLRLGLRNRLQTKREGQIENLVYWEVYTDWRLDRNPNQTTFSDVYSDLAFRPRSWITLESRTATDVEEGVLRSASEALVLRPNHIWSWGISYWYSRDDFRPAPYGLGEGSEWIQNVIFLRLNENWALRAAHNYDLREGRLAEQGYTVYRDMRNWTAGFTFRVKDDDNHGHDFGFAFTFSLKAMPKFNVGGDAVRPSQLLGY